MPQPTNCFICKNTWLGAGPICDDCNYRVSGPYTNAQTAHTHTPPLQCNFCGGNHYESQCLAASLAQQYNTNPLKQAHIKQHASYYNNAMKQVAAQMATQQQAQMANRTRHRPYSTTTGRRSKPYTNYYDSSSPPMKYCSACKQHQRLETKAGSICTNCKAITRNPCRNCNSGSTHGLAGDSMQFIECNDCLFIE